MKHIVPFLLSTLLLVNLVACGIRQPVENVGAVSEIVQSGSTGNPGAVSKADKQSTDPGNTFNDSTQSEAEGHVLIAYFAYNENIGDTSGMTTDAIASASLGQSTGNETGNLQAIAQVIQEKTGGNIHQILVTEPYDPVYDVMRERAYDELDNGTLPELQSQVDNLDQYDVIYLGMPVWSGQMPAPVTAFLTENNPSGKTIIPFSVNLGSGFGRAKSQLEDLCPDATVLDAFTIRADTAYDDVRSAANTWLDELEVVQS